jgi:hypothetical protein
MAAIPAAVISMAAAIAADFWTFMAGLLVTSLTSVVVNYNTKNQAVNTPCHQSWVGGEVAASLWYPGARSHSCLRAPKA